MRARTPRRTRRKQSTRAANRLTTPFWLFSRLIERSTGPTGTSSRTPTAGRSGHIDRAIAVDVRAGRNRPLGSHRHRARQRCGSGLEKPIWRSAGPGGTSAAHRRRPARPGLRRAPRLRSPLRPRRPGRPAAPATRLHLSKHHGAACDGRKAIRDSCPHEATSFPALLRADLVRVRLRQALKAPIRRPRRAARRHPDPAWRPSRRSPGPPPRRATAAQARSRRGSRPC